MAYGLHANKLNQHMDGKWKKIENYKRKRRVQLDTFGAKRYCGLNL